METAIKNNVSESIESIQIDNDPISKSIDIKFIYSNQSSQTLSQSYEVLLRLLTMGRQ